MSSISLFTPSEITGRRIAAVPAPHIPTNVCFPHQLRISAGYSTADQRAKETSLQTGSLYEILGIQSNASCQEIKSAYRKVARLLHPDVASNSKGGGATTEEFMRLHAAYATLSDPEKRAMYDVTLSRRRRREARLAASSFPEVEGRRRTWETEQCW
ncbi:chaperone protein dnaJ 11, chloroplastic-like [Dorcoceras hygrometricum]|uniref:Chaperone protein dnaJ 11, chloroplastic-like n=1 Tax=Dorcoceras hygrometricum TaxID=472368 RepID=A0A2Z7AGG3_9LAMI|nr:chaperone protein dnaJ 11, chloroplastic-like [Dorcoceras hygrometricum]